MSTLKDYIKIIEKITQLKQLYESELKIRGIYGNTIHTWILDHRKSWTYTLEVPEDLIERNLEELTDKQLRERYYDVLKMMDN